MSTIQVSRDALIPEISDEPDNHRFVEIGDGGGTGIQALVFEDSRCRARDNLCYRPLDTDLIQFQIGPLGQRTGGQRGTRRTKYWYRIQDLGNSQRYGKQIEWTSGLLLPFPAAILSSASGPDDRSGTRISEQPAASPAQIASRLVQLIVGSPFWKRHFLCVCFSRVACLLRSHRKFLVVSGSAVLSVLFLRRERDMLGLGMSRYSSALRRRIGQLRQQ